MDTNVGFEFEFTSSLSHNEIRKLLKERGIKFTGAGKWRLTSDGSVSSSRRWYESVELISPPMPIKEAITTLKTVFAFMSDIPCDVNRTCGLHINMDIGKATTKRIDPTKLVVLVDEVRVAEKYGRSRAHYALPHNSKIRQQARYWAKLKNKPEPLKEYVKRWALDRDELMEKYSAINFRKQKRLGYIEFRMVGNKDYHKRYSEIKRDLLHFEQCMIKAADPIMGEKAIARRLNKLAA